jgi:hypothetical protein
MLGYRSDAEPWIVQRSDLDTYVEKKILPLCEHYEDDVPPAYLLWSDDTVKELYVATNTLKFVVDCPSPDIPVRMVTHEELLALIGQMSVAHAALEQARRLQQQAVEGGGGSGVVPPLLN